MQVPMTKIEIIGHRSELDTTLEVLHRCRSVQLIDVATVAGVGVPPLSVDPAHQAELEELRFLRVRLDAVLDLIPDPGEEVIAAPLDRAELSDLRERLDEIAPRVEELVGTIDRLDQEKAVLPRYVRSLRSLLPLVPGLPQLGGYETTALLIESRHAHVIGELHTRLAEVTDSRFELITEQVDPDTVGAVLIFPRSVARNVFDLLGREQVSRVRLPERFEGMPFREAVAAMERRISEIPGERDETGRMLGELVKPMGEWRAVRAGIVSRIDQLEAIRHLGTTQHTFVAVGWMPHGRLEQFTRTLAENVGSRVVVEEIGIEAGDHPPVLLENPKPARPFEFLVRLLSVPAYGSIDPTTLMTFFLPLFFGIMLGDIVYGTVLLALALWARHHWRRRSAVVADLSRIFIYGSLWSIVWGVIYGEFLGNLGHTWLGLEPIWINREEAIEPLLLFSLALGAAHITLGLVLGIWSAIRLHKPRLLLERAGTMAALIGLFVVVGAVAEVLPSGLLTPAVAAVIVGVVIMGFVEGLLGMVIGPLEFVSLVGNVLSYLRIGAIGLASVYLARVANELGASGPIWVGVLIATLFHVLNLALGAFSPTIQALRLHYVEFFGKFYEEGGNAFEPFGRPLSH